MTTLPGDAPDDEKRKAELRREVYKILTGEDPRYYKHKFFGGWKETDKTEGNLWSAVKSDADILLSREDGLPDDLISIAEPTVKAAAVMFAAHVVGAEIALLSEGIEAFGAYNAVTMYTNGALKSNLAYYQNISSMTDVDDQVGINVLNATDEDEKLMAEIIEVKEGTSKAGDSIRRGYHKEVYGNRPVKVEEAVDKWDEFLGPKPHNNVHPRTGQTDADRIFSQDGTRSIRFGSHEMNSKPTKFHYHEETWTYDPIDNVMNVDNTVIRVPYKK